MQEQQQSQEPVKDEYAAHPIADAWRPAFKEIIKAFVEGDFAFHRGLQFVAPVPSSTGDQIKTYIAGYGETLAELPNETWETSIAQWMGTHWDVLVDLWTAESGGSDFGLERSRVRGRGQLSNRDRFYTRPMITRPSEALARARHRGRGEGIASLASLWGM